MEYIAKIVYLLLAFKTCNWKTVPPLSKYPVSDTYLLMRIALQTA